MNAKDLLGKKIIDKKARDLTKLAEIELDMNTFTIAKVYGSIGNPLSKKYYEITSDKILAVGDYVQVSNTIEELEEGLLDKIPESEGKNVKVNSLIGKTALDSEGNVAGKVSNIDLDLEKFEIVGFNISEQSSSFMKANKENEITKDDITSIGDYIIINKVFTEEKEEEEPEKSEDSVNIDIE